MTGNVPPACSPTMHCIEVSVMDEILHGEPSIPTATRAVSEPKPKPETVIAVPLGPVV